MPFLHMLQHLEPVNLGHHDIEDDNIVISLVDFSQGLPAVLHGINDIIAVAKYAQATPNDDLFVVNDQYPGAHCVPSPALRSASPNGDVIGRRMRKVLPTPTTLSTLIPPPCAL